MNDTLNIGLLAHVDAGKTTLTEKLLLLSGQTRKAGSVDDGTTHTDFLSVERERGISVKSAVTSIEYKGRRINIIDTPGHVDFAAEVERSLCVLDLAVLIISAAEGIQAQTEILFNALKATKTNIVIFINKTDRPGVGVDAVLNAIRTDFDKNVLLMTEVSGEGSRETSVKLKPFTGVFANEITALCGEFDDSLAEKYITGEDISESELKASLATSVNAGKIIPVFCGSAQNDVGVNELLDFIAEYMRPVRNLEGDALSGVIFKLEHDKSMGKISYVRLFSGELKNRDSIILPHGENKITQIRRPFADKYTDVGILTKGDVAAVCGLSNAKVGDIIGERNGLLRDYALSVPLLRVRVLHGDNVSVSQVLTAFRELSEEDPKLDCEYNEDEKEIDISITGMIQLEILSSLVRERYGFDVTFSEPTVIYKETPSSHGFGYDAYTMPKPCWAVIKFEIEPLPRGSGLQYSSIVPNGKILYRYQRHIETCLPEALKQGVYNWEVVDLKVTLVDGGSHHIHTHPLDFFLCTPLALIDGLQNTGTTLLEPVNTLRITAPEEYAGRIIGDMVAMRGVYDSPVIKNGSITLESHVPLSESMDYAVRLAMATSGKAVMSSRFYQYDICPEGLGKATKRRGVDPRDRAKWILYHRNAMRDAD